MAKAIYMNTMEEPIHPPEEVPAHTGRFRGDNLLLLLDLPVSARVLVIGDRLESWRDAFRNAGFIGCVPAHTTNGEPFDLVLYHSGSAVTKNIFVEDLKQLRSSISVSGTLLLFGENRYSFAGLKKIRHGRLDQFHGVRCGYSGYAKLLARTGFRAVRGFVPMPGLDAVEELWPAESPDMEIPHYSHLLLHLAHRLGCFRQIADGYLFVAASAAIEDGDLFQAIARALYAPGATCGAGFLLERVDLRSRGGMVLFIAGTGSTERFIARVVSDAKTDGIIGKNHGFVQFLRDYPGMPAEMKKLLPFPMRRLEHGSSAVYVESMLEGVPAWKVNKSGLRERIFRESVEFIITLSRVTKQTATLGERDIERLFEEDLSRINGCGVMDAHIRRDMATLIEKLASLLHRRELFLVASHGDYGYGNILVDPDNGSLKGVIDWDTGKPADLPGVDLFNLHVQRARTEKNCGVFEAVREVAPGFISPRPGDTLNAFFDDLRIRGELNKAVVYLGFIRFVSRSAQYPEVFIQEQGELQSIHDFLRGAFPL